MAQINMLGVSKRFGDLEVVSATTLEIKDGEFDQFMYDEGIFSHAITGAGTMRFTKKLAIIIPNSNNIQAGIASND